MSERETQINDLYKYIELQFHLLNQLPTDTLKTTYAYRSNSFSRIMIYKLAIL